MIVELPGPRGFAAAVLAGLTQVSSTETPEMAVVLKAGYDLVEDEAGVHDLVLSGDPAGTAIVFEDSGRHLYTDGDGATHVIRADAFGTVPKDEPREGDRFFTHEGERVFIKDLAEPRKLAFDLTCEADIALDKLRADIVVEGFRSAPPRGPWWSMARSGCGAPPPCRSGWTRAATSSAGTAGASRAGSARSPRATIP
jgi:hypothetical protein